MASRRPVPPHKIAEFIQNLEDMCNSTGKHTGHTVRQHGRCIVCSCGDRVQGRLPRT